ncbi:nucleotidyl transferase AbiEii/AbiGii toxin family protein [Patescibacteria group bacterium]|nr:nucleotidyl transferase AbiEii/AbiGii toxin family protein [Patescibacteria group bacterium]MBU2472794.1 nucleotidyl transferase AbiEii/AbiGii toxin family protein [Patescibacteria group bacterium]
MQLEVLKSEQKKIFLKLKKFPEFYLIGGTALALQIGHRISIDFDLFSQKDIPKSLLPKIKRVFEGSKIEILVNHAEQLSVKADGVKIDFVKYKFSLISEPIEFEGINILLIPEIAAMKAYTLNYRGTLKDYIDLYFILKDKHTTLEEIESLTDKKYKDEFNFRLFLEQLVYLEGLREEKIEFLKEQVNKKEMQEFFEREIQKFGIK